MPESSFDSFPCLIPMVTRTEYCTDFVGEHLEGNTPITLGRAGMRCCAQPVVADASLENLEMKLT